MDRGVLYDTRALLSSVNGKLGPGNDDEAKGW
jgi:hypothetical protein